LKRREDFTASFIRGISFQKACTAVGKYTEINLDRFLCDFELDSTKGPFFHVYFENFTAVQDIIGFPEIWRSVITVNGSNPYVVFDIDLPSNAYSKLDAIISSNTISLDMTSSNLEGAHIESGTGIPFTQQDPLPP